MAITQTVYYQDPYLHELDVQVVSIEPYQSQYQAVQLDRTICYPEGGGQPGDRALLGDLPIVDTVKGSDGTILHIVSSDSTVMVDARYRLVLDWPHRYEYMQQHTAQHLISGLLFSQFGIGTVSVHQGEEILTIETDQESIALEVLQDLEAMVNRAICSKVSVSYEERSHEEAQDIGLRRSIKVEGDVRLVRIGDLDIIACGGLHVAGTDEIGIVLFSGIEMIRGHVRTIWKTADRAMAEVHRNQQVVKELGAAFSSQPDELVVKAKQLQTQLVDSQWHRNRLAAKLASLLLLSQITRSEHVHGTPVVVLDLTTEPELSLKHLAEQMEAFEAIALCAVQELDGRLSWMVCIKGPLSQTVPFDMVRAQLLPLIEGKGGGRPPLWQGVGTRLDARQQLLDGFVKMMSEKDTK